MQFITVKIEKPDDTNLIVLIVIENGGHTWPGRTLPAAFTGTSAINISANDLMWNSL